VSVRLDRWATLRPQVTDGLAASLAEVRLSREGPGTHSESPSCAALHRASSLIACVTTAQLAEATSERAVSVSSLRIVEPLTMSFTAAICRGVFKVRLAASSLSPSLASW
jgi:hypothetical protein